MKYSLLLVLLLPVTTLAAQTRVRASLGGTYGTALVYDVVASDNVKYRPKIAPTLAIAVIKPIGQGYNLLLEGSAGHSSLETASDLDSSTKGGLTTAGITVLVDGAAYYGFRWQVGAGALFYAPSEHSGVFLIDAPKHWLLAGGVSWSRKLSTGMDFVVTARADLHNFTTSSLIQHGFSGSQTVKRFALFAGVERAF